MSPPLRCLQVCSSQLITHCPQHLCQRIQQKILGIPHPKSSLKPQAVNQHMLSTLHEDDEQRKSGHNGQLRHRRPSYGNDETRINSNREGHFLHELLRSEYESYRIQMLTIT